MDAGIGGKYTFSDGTPTHICIHFIFINAAAYIFPVMISVYLHWNFYGGRRNFCLFLRAGHFGRSRSSKVDKFGANRKRICDFLL